jgi:two-component system OmpR family sensor kinase
MKRLPIRVRLTLAFAVAIGAVLAGGGFLLYHHLADSLDRTLDQGLRARAADVAAIVRHGDPGLREAPPAPVADASGSFAQVLDRRGTIRDQSPGLGQHPLLAGPLLRRAQTETLLIGRAHRLGGDVRLLAIPLGANKQKLVLIVGAPLRSRDRTLANLRSELLVGGPAALLLASLIGYLVAGAALRPVERMRTRAAAITEQHLSERLPVPSANDEIARLGATLNQMLGRVERALKRERSFVADASHELRAPLALIRTEVDLALDLPRSADELQTALRSIGEEADRLSQLADHLLLLARLDEGELPLRKEALDAHELLGDVAERFRRRAADDGRRIDVDAPKLGVEADRVRLEQALVNLVDNALRHGAGTVTLTASSGADGVEIHIADEGPGFDNGVTETAFERFTRGDQARSSRGAGLGLAIVKAIVTAHKGSVAVSTDTARGADVVLTLPPAPALPVRARDQHAEIGGDSAGDGPLVATTKGTS